MEVKEFYLNKIQWAIRDAFLSGEYKNVVAVCGRGTGKSFTIGNYLFSCIDTMPRSRGILGGPSGNAILNRILPSVQESWERMGLKEGREEDYVIGQKPPSHWEKPISKVEDFRKVISFWNGSAIDLVSFYNEGAARGPSYQFFAGDEMAWVRRENFAQAVFPALRGGYYNKASLPIYPNKNGEIEKPEFGKIVVKGLRYYWEIPFRENPFYCSTLVCTSQPYLEKGQWVWDYETDPDVFYIEGTPFDNQEVLGPDYVKRQRKVLSEVEFRIEILNERIRQKTDGFYSKFKSDKHVIDKNPYDSTRELQLSFDFGKFLGCIVCQDINGQATVIDNLYVNNGSVEDLMKQFEERYSTHSNRRVTVYGDVSGNNKRGPEHNFTSVYDELQNAFIDNGWIYYRPYYPFNPPHSEKHLLINKALEESNAMNMVPIRIYEECRALIASIMGAGMMDDYKKDKRTEHPNNPTKAEESTHLSDAFDYWYYRKYALGYMTSQASDMDIGIS